MRVITLLTDFGLEDGYVAAMKGVVAAIAPDARLVDVTHLVPPQDVASGRFRLLTVVPYFPPGTIHLAVVDPGVGTARRAVAIRSASGSYFVGPDNGLLLGALETESAGGGGGALRAPLLADAHAKRDVSRARRLRSGRRAPGKGRGPRSARTHHRTGDPRAARARAVQDARRWRRGSRPGGGPVRQPDLQRAGLACSRAAERGAHRWARAPSRVTGPTATSPWARRSRSWEATASSRSPSTAETHGAR